MTKDHATAYKQLRHALSAKNIYDKETSEAATRTDVKKIQVLGFQSMTGQARSYCHVFGLF